MEVATLAPMLNLGLVPEWRRILLLDNSVFANEDLRKWHRVAFARLTQITALEYLNNEEIVLWLRNQMSTWGLPSVQRGPLIRAMFYSCTRNVYLANLQAIAPMLNVCADDFDVYVNIWVRRIVENGQLKLLRWLQRSFAIVSPHFFTEHPFLLNYATRNGHVQMAEWLIEEFNIDRILFLSDENALYRVIKRNYFFLVQWLVNYFNLDKEDVNKSYSGFYIAAMYGRLEILQWLVEELRYGKIDLFASNLLMQVVICGQLASFRWFVEYFDLSYQDITKNYNCLFESIRYKQWDIFMWIINYFDIDLEKNIREQIVCILRLLAEDERLDVMYWLSEQINIVPREFVTGRSNAFLALIASNNFESLKCVVRNFNITPEDTKRIFLHYENIRCTKEIRNWLIETFNVRPSSFK